LWAISRSGNEMAEGIYVSFSDLEMKWQNVIVEYFQIWK
jgi:hypothetical protein